MWCTRKTRMWLTALLACGVAAVTGCGGTGEQPASTQGKGAATFTVQWPAGVNSAEITPTTEEILVRCTATGLEPVEVILARPSGTNATTITRTVWLAPGQWTFWAFGFADNKRLEIRGANEARIEAGARTRVPVDLAGMGRSASRQWAMFPDDDALIFYPGETTRNLHLRSVTPPPPFPSASPAAGDPPLTWSMTVSPTDAGTSWVQMSTPSLDAVEGDVTVTIDRSALPFDTNVAILRIDAGTAGWRDIAVVATEQVPDVTPPVWSSETCARTSH